MSYFDIAEYLETIKKHELKRPLCSIQKTHFTRMYFLLYFRIKESQAEFYVFYM